MQSLHNHKRDQACLDQKCFPNKHLRSAALDPNCLFLDSTWIGTCGLTPARFTSLKDDAAHLFSRQYCFGNSFSGERLFNGRPRT